jgi:hypothetical protein
MTAVVHNPSVEAPAFMRGKCRSLRTTALAAEGKGKNPRLKADRVGRTIGPADKSGGFHQEIRFRFNAGIPVWLAHFAD